jgi:hypothetical protein
MFHVNSILRLGKKAGGKMEGGLIFGGRLGKIGEEGNDFCQLLSNPLFRMNGIKKLDWGE